MIDFFVYMFVGIGIIVLQLCFFALLDLVDSVVDFILTTVKNYISISHELEQWLVGTALTLYIVCSLSFLGFSGSWILGVF